MLKPDEETAIPVPESNPEEKQRILVKWDKIAKDAQNKESSGINPCLNNSYLAELEKDKTLLSEDEYNTIKLELMRLIGLSTGETFQETNIDRMKEYFVKNVEKDSPDVCIVTMNKGLKKLYGNNKLKVGSEVQSTMKKFQHQGLAGNPVIIEFLDKDGKLTQGAKEPSSLNKSIGKVLIELCKGIPGWHVFGLSIMDGYHSVTITVDMTNPSEPEIFWSDQWPSHGGMMEYTKEEIDDTITDFTISWWREFKRKKGTRSKTRTTLWKLKSNYKKKE